jgi:hypothetical protein
MSHFHTKNIMNNSSNHSLFATNADGSDPMMEAVIQELIAQGVTAEEVGGKLDQIIDDRLPKAAMAFLVALKKDAKRMLADQRKLRQGFEKRLLEKWSKPFDLLLMLIVTSTEAGEDYNATLRPAAATENDYVFDALIKLHARSCLVGSEILWLMRGGFASAAMARWRTLHEIAAVSLFIKANGQDVAERYLLHHIVESVRAAHQYQEHHVRLGDEQFSQKELDKMDADREHLCSRFGKEFRDDWGWAANALGKGNVSFADIEKAVSLEHLRPYFKLASYSNHAGGKGIVFDLGKGLMPPGQHVMLAGPSDAGMDEPGQSTAIAINQIVANLLTHRKMTVSSWTFGRAFQLLTEETIAAFADAANKLEDRAKRSHKDRGL